MGMFLKKYNTIAHFSLFFFLMIINYQIRLANPRKQVPERMKEEIFFLWKWDRGGGEMG